MSPWQRANAERLYRETDGLPYFVVEYLEALRAQRDQIGRCRAMCAIFAVAPAECQLRRGGDCCKRPSLSGARSSLDTLRVGQRPQ